MGRIITSRGELVESLTELVGFKAGLALTREELLAHIPEQADLFLGDDNDGVSIRAETYEELAGELLNAVGAVRSPHPQFGLMALAVKYQNDPQSREMFADAMTVIQESAEVSAPNGSPIDVTPVIVELNKKYGRTGYEFAKQFVETLTEHVIGSPWSKMRRIEWTDQVELKSLFDDAGLATQYGTFFDQRFIDYLSKSFGSIDRIHWRQFERLTCEYFSRLGCKVVIGPGSNDDNVDARVWWPSDDESKPAAILVQCKRQKEAVGKVIVKALYADILHEGAEAGLIVTSQRLAVGADTVRVARRYPISTADRASLCAWIDAMKTK